MEFEAEMFVCVFVYIIYVCVLGRDVVHWQGEQRKCLQIPEAEDVGGRRKRAAAGLEQEQEEGGGVGRERGVEKRGWVSQCGSRKGCGCHTTVGGKRGWVSHCTVGGEKGCGCHTVGGEKGVGVTLQVEKRGVWGPDMENGSEMQQMETSEEIFLKMDKITSKGEHSFQFWETKIVLRR